MKYIITDTAISIFFRDETESVVSKANRNYHAIVNLILESIEEDRPISFDEEIKIKELIDISSFVEDASNGKMRLLNGNPQILVADGPNEVEVWKDIDLKTHQRLQHFVEKGVPLDPFIQFYTSLDHNPSRNSREQLFDFIDNREMPVLPTGEVIGYKGVNDEYMDIYTGEVDNRVGAIISMDRKDVDDNPGNSCSYGFHIGSHNYANSWRGDKGKLMLVAFYPKDAVSVPNDGCEKLRVCKYRVLADITNNPHPLGQPAYTADGTDITEIEASKTNEHDWSTVNLDLCKKAEMKNWILRKMHRGKPPKVSKFLARYHLEHEDMLSFLKDLNDEGLGMFTHGGRIYSGSVNYSN